MSPEPNKENNDLNTLRLKEEKVRIPVEVREKMLKIIQKWVEESGGSSDRGKEAQPTDRLKSR